MDGALGLPSPVDRDRRKMVVMDSPQFACGVQVDDLLDVFYLVSTDINPISSVAGGVGREYLRGTATREERMFSFIDLSALLTNGSLAVIENP
jgi:chemotaxis signal transduction protein